MNWIAIWVTCKLAGLTAVALLFVGLPIAYWLSFSRWRWKFLIESVVALPLVLPHAIDPEVYLDRFAPSGVVTNM